MKLTFWLAAMGLFFWGFTNTPTHRQANSGVVMILIGGNLHGQLSPCGCTRPMSGGLTRRVSVFKQFKAMGATVILDTGDWVKGQEPQDVMKAETVADTLSVVPADAVLPTASMVRLGPTEEANLHTLSGSSQWLDGDLPVTSNGLTIYRATPGQALPTLDPSSGLRVVMTEGDLAFAKQIARSQVGSLLVVYKSVGSPDPNPIKENGSWLVSPGDSGKDLVAVTVNKGALSKYGTVELTEEKGDDPDTTAVFNLYHSRVARSELLEHYPRIPGDPYAGSKTCGNCHASAYQVWTGSRHSHALADLETVKSDRDPDCVPCHVVDLSSATGFHSRTLTPDLANVGCEACHGAGVKHAENPKNVAMPKVGLDKCLQCHDTENSPLFDPKSAWKTISHGVVDKEK